MDKILEIKLVIPFHTAVEHVREKLAKHGFGIITEINVKKTFKKKLDVDFKNYVILGACNPGFAHRALNASDNVGLLLPCNVIVHEGTDNTVTVSTMKPTHMLNILESSEVCKVGAEAEEALTKAFQSM